jgi:hypothetical protein
MRACIAAEERNRIKKLESEVRGLRQANEIFHKTPRL